MTIKTAYLALEIHVIVYNTSAKNADMGMQGQIDEEGRCARSTNLLPFLFLDFSSEVPVHTDASCSLLLILVEVHHHRHDAEENQAISHNHQKKDKATIIHQIPYTTRDLEAMDYPTASVISSLVVIVIHCPVSGFCFSLRFSSGSCCRASMNFSIFA